MGTLLHERKGVGDTSSGFEYSCYVGSQTNNIVNKMAYNKKIVCL